MRKCTNKDCIHEGKPQDKSNFSKIWKNSDDLQYWCKDCYRQYQRDNPEVSAKSTKRWQENNPESYKKKCRKYRQSEKGKKKRKEWKKNNPEKVKEIQKRYKLKAKK